MMSSMRTPLPPSFTLLFYYLLLSVFGGGGAPPLFFIIPTTTIFVSAGIMKTNPCPEVPTLICQHGSFCTPGNANYGPEHAHLQLQTSESGYYCDCKNDGYIGHECQISVDKCTGGNDDGVPFCYHGAQCQVRKGKYYCDCHTLNQHSSSTAVKYAGSTCQHPSTSFCATSLVENHAPNFQFCTNDGICNRWVQDGESHPGCSCLDGYAGERCEIEMNDPYADMARYNSSGTGGGNSAARTAGIVLLVLALVILIPVITCLVMRARRRKRRNALVTTPAGTTTSTTTPIANGDGKTVVGEGDLDADGSGTLGSLIIHDEKNGDATENGNGAHHVEDDYDENDDDGLTTEVDDKADDAANGEAKNGNAAPLSEIV